VGKFSEFIKKFQAQPASQKPNLTEVSISHSGLFRSWPSQPFNPMDTLSQVKGLQIYEAMRSDDQVKAALNLKKGAMLSTGWEIVSASDAPEDKKIRNFVEDVFTNLDTLYGSFDDVLFEILSAFDFGFSISEILWNILDRGEFKGKVGLRTIKSRRPHSFGFDMDEHDNLLKNGIVQREDRFDPNKFLIYTFQKEFGNFYGLSDLRAAYRPWWMKDNIMKWWAIYLERFGVPLTIGKYPSTHPRASDIDTLRDILQNLQANTSMTFPDVFEIEFKEASGRGSDVFKGAVEEMNLAIARSLLVPSLLGVSTQQDTGSFSQSRKHFDIFLIVIDDARRDVQEDVIQNQLITRLVDFNFQVDEYPQFEFKQFTEENRLELFGKWLEAVEKGVVKPTSEDEIHIRSTVNFPDREIPEGEVPIALKPPPAPPAPTMPAPQPQPEPEPDAGEPTADEIARGARAAPTFSRFQLLRKPNRFEKKANFQRINDSLDAIQSESQGRIESTINRTFEALLSIISRKMESGELTPRFVVSLDLKYKGDLTRELREYLSSSYTIGTREAKDMLPRRMQARIIPGIPPKKALQFFDTKAIFNKGIINDQLKNSSQGVLFNAIKNGEPFNVTSEKLRKAFNPFIGDRTAIKKGAEKLVTDPARLETVLRTNATEAFNKGLIDEVEAEVESGFVIGFMYSAILDSVTTEVCRCLDGHIFKPGGTGIQQLTPPNHFNCRSSLIPVTSDEAPVDFISTSQQGNCEELKATGFSDEKETWQTEKDSD